MNSEELSSQAILGIHRFLSEVKCEYLSIRHNSALVKIFVKILTRQAYLIWLLRLFSWNCDSFETDLGEHVLFPICDPFSQFSAMRS